MIILFCTKFYYNNTCDHLIMTRTSEFDAPSPFRAGKKNVRRVSHSRFRTIVSCPTEYVTTTAYRYYNIVIIVIASYHAVVDRLSAVNHAARRRFRWIHVLCTMFCAHECRDRSPVEYKIPINYNWRCPPSGVIVVGRWYVIIIVCTIDSYVVLDVTWYLSF